MAGQIGKDLWRLEIPLIGNPLKNLNSYLLTGPRSLLIDTGFRQEPCRAAMERQLAEIGVDRDRMTSSSPICTAITPGLRRSWSVRGAGCISAGWTARG